MNNKVFGIALTFMVYNSFFMGLLVGLAWGGDYSYKKSCEGNTYGAIADARAEGEPRENLRCITSENWKTKVKHIYAERRIDGQWVPINQINVREWGEDYRNREWFEVVKVLSYGECVGRLIWLTPKRTVAEP